MNVMIEALPESMPNHADVDALPASMPNHDDVDDLWEDIGKASSVGSVQPAHEDFSSADEAEPEASVGEVCPIKAAAIEPTASEPDVDCFSIGS
jgi:hypothetical protein